MAKDDYNVILYKILVYLYACMKRRILFNERTFREAVGKNAGSDEYLVSILYMAQRDGLIDGLAFQTAWGKTRILVSDIRDAEITSKGIEYLAENSMMQKVGRALRESADAIAELASIIQLA